MSKEMLNDPHLKQNPYTVPEDYFRMVTEEWQMESAVEQTVESEHSRLSLRSLFQFAASFALLFGIGYALFMLTGRNRADSQQTEEYSLFSELSELGLSHQTVSSFFITDMDEFREPAPETDLDLDELIEYMNYPGMDIESLQIDNE
jgi:hypothetical protein